MADLKKFFKKTALTREPSEGPSVPEGLWIKCPRCGEMVYREDVVNHFYVCPKCGGYFRIKASTRIRSVTDGGSFRPWFTALENSNPLDYPGYPEKIRELRSKTGMDEAVLVGEASIKGRPVAMGVMDSRFLMASR